MATYRVEFIVDTEDMTEDDVDYADVYSGRELEREVLHYIIEKETDWLRDNANVQRIESWCNQCTEKCKTSESGKNWICPKCGDVTPKS